MMYFYVWLLSLNIVRFKLLHLSVIYFHFCVVFNFLNVLHFIRSTIGKHLDCWNLGAIIYNAAMNILVHTCMYISVGGGMVGSKAVLMFSCTRFC